MMEQLNKIFTIFSLLIVGIGYGQIKFSEKESGFSSESVLLEFDDNDENDENDENYKGLILPSVKSNDNNSVDGTLIFDINDNNIKAKVDGIWVSLTDKDPDTQIAIDVEVNDSEDIGKGVFIGDNENENELNINGALVLSSSDKAMVLPKIKNPHENVIRPYPGFICYDTESDMLALFDGAVWHYWK